MLRYGVQAMQWIEMATYVHHSNAEGHRKAEVAIRIYSLGNEEYSIDRAIAPRSDGLYIPHPNYKRRDLVLGIWAFN